MDDDWKSLILPSVSANMPTRRESSSVKRALSDRLTPSEAIEAAGKMIRGYPQAKDAPKSYIGAMADLLTRYPRSVALACVDLATGVASETRYMPTPSEVIGWCERKARPLHEEAAREDRVREQLAARETWLQPDRSADEVAHRKEIADAWLSRVDPKAHDLGLK